MLAKKILTKCRKIRLVISDVDGVLTDGGMYYTNEGEYMKKFHTRDGMAVELLLKHGIKTIIMTKEKSNIVRTRAKKIKAVRSYLNVLDKKAKLDDICAEFNVNPIEIAYIGDDMNDLGIMIKVGLSATPSDGIGEIKNVADYICHSKGGEGVLREIADMILSTK
jgi:YrbI family 3-deoxy-D-manno-octulosonate 8-phosphate phosphatase